MDKRLWRNGSNSRFRIVLACAMLALGCGGSAQPNQPGSSEASSNTPAIRVGYFPNITHAQALVGRARGDFDKALGPNAHIEWRSFGAGPAEIEALFANAIDLAYVGPNPAVTGYVRSQGQALRIIAGAASGGASLVVRTGANIQKPADFHNRRVASPQLGNTQDVALRAWLRANGMTPREKGGDVDVIPTSNADQLTLFLKGQLDAAWAPEPWATLLVHDGGGRIFIDERDLWPGHQFATASIIANPKFMADHPDLVKAFLRAHVELTEWINQNPQQAREIVNQQLQKETREALASDVLNDAFARMEVTYDPIRSSVLQSAKEAFAEGFLGRTPPDVSGLFDLALLNQVLAEQKIKPVE